MASKKQFIILSAMGYSKDEIADMSEEVAWNTIAKNGGSENIGFHYGDLGKADKREIMAGRDTGHFGTGTYFFGSRESNGAERYKETRPEHIVNFDNYNLFKPRDNAQGMKLHETLKKVNKFDKYDKAVIDKNDGDLFDEYINLPYLDKDAYKDYLTKYDAWEDEYEEYDKYELKDKVKEVFDELQEIRWELDDTIFNLSYLMGDTKENIKKNLLKAVNSNTENSVSTEFMKSYGYEGVDVRHLNTDGQGYQGLDNSGFGSVIYDLRSESEIKRIKEK